MSNEIIKLDVPSVPDGFEWDYGFEIFVQSALNGVTISANKAGLISLARHLLSLAKDDSPVGNHFHLDDLNSLEDGSIELIVEKI
ncbi:hypothetical protein [Candidatus Albibeggiatoa sp. nov. NOAA]|uniref:Imm32 family immunity protein n=1 Tax=Candidatus Albibeggiatoa sp. nov. NOAA TaxID=3162724 RepID=UPI0032FDE8BB|nr:hypothetical protein [Thiotrichaceae bacterium]